MEKETKVKKKSTLVEIKPLKDFKIRMNQYSYDLKKGEKIEVPELFLPNLKTEKVIK